MNTPTFTAVKPSTDMQRPSRVLGYGLWLSLMIAMIAMWPSLNVARADWDIDFSRRASKTREADLNSAAKSPNSRTPASARAPAPAAESAAQSDITEATVPVAKRGVFEALFDAGEPIQDLVILHTEKGFVPATVRVRKGGRYRISVVNVNEKEKNVSFILDGFSEHHATYYGKIKTFMLEPKKEGAYSFQSPETSSEGKLIVFSPQATVRAPASEE